MHIVWIQVSNPTGWFHKIVVSVTVGRDLEKTQQTKCFPEQFLLPQLAFLLTPLWDWSPSCPCAVIIISSVVLNTSWKGSHHNWNIKMMYKPRKLAFILDHPKHSCSTADSWDETMLLLGVCLERLRGACKLETQAEHHPDVDLHVRSVSRALRNQQKSQHFYLWNSALTGVLVLAGTELIFFTTAGTGLYFG